MGPIDKPKMSGAGQAAADRPKFRLFGAEGRPRVANCHIEAWQDSRARAIAMSRGNFLVPG